ncbi:hypothetical protein [Streptomyces sp. NPDC002537]
MSDETSDDQQRSPGQRAVGPADLPTASAAPAWRRRRVLVSGVIAILITTAVVLINVFEPEHEKTLPTGIEQPVDTRAAPAPDHRLSAPETVLGDYHRGHGTGISTKERNGENLFMWLGMKAPRVAASLYEQPDDEEGATRALMFRGGWGRVEDPGKAVDLYFFFLTKTAPVPMRGPAMELDAGKPEKFSPRGLDDATMKCQFAHEKRSDPGASPLPVPLCVWADHDTVGATFVFDFVKAGGAGASLAEAADAAARLRGEIRVPSR